MPVRTLHNSFTLSTHAMPIASNTLGCPRHDPRYHFIHTMILTFARAMTSRS